MASITDDLMLGTETRTLIEKAGGRRQIELSARFVDASPGPPGHDPRADAVREQVWTDLKAAIVAAVAAYEGEGLKVLRHLKTRPEMILSGPAATWRRFLEENRALVVGPSVEFRHYVQPWSHGLPGFPE